jgi:autotransporter-associated beta strand protein
MNWFSAAVMVGLWWCAATVAAPPWPSYVITNFVDEFNGASLDTNVWKVDGYRTNVTVTGGNLQLITALDGGTAWREGFIYSRLFSQKYGYYEARIKINNASGLNNAFWLNSPYGIAYDNVDRLEIDITESHYADRTSHMTLHDWSPTHSSMGEDYVHGSDLSTDYHLFGLEWAHDNTLRFYFDGSNKWTISASTFLGLNSLIPQAVLFSTKVIPWAGTPDTNVLIGSHMDVDWVRVYQKRGWSGVLNGNWGSATNWGPDGVPTDSDAAIFNQPATTTAISLAADKSCQSLYFCNPQCPAFTFAAGVYALHLGAAPAGIGGITIETTVTKSQTINLDLYADRDLQFGNFSRTPGVTLVLNGQLTATNTGRALFFGGLGPIAVNGSISSNIATVTKFSNNELVLTATNRHTGLTIVLNGTLVVAADSALGTTNAATIVTNGATLAFTSNVTYTALEPIRLDGIGDTAAGRAGALDLDTGPAPVSPAA